MSVPVDEDSNGLIDPFYVPPISEGAHRKIRKRQMRHPENTQWCYLYDKDMGIDIGDITGKYLFFSSDVKVLKLIARTEIREHGFKMAKWSKEARGKDHVLCLYWTDDSRKHELAGRYKAMANVRYRYWKSDADTRAGKYSDQFRNGG